ncbi:MAG: SDR family NAD(P)-dependent oxidoreductase, partial [Actinomycetia bacterium]|nr:SDR family NAD(P)-dependent oxidoreductase [Actinomycetes bacterium]
DAVDLLINNAGINAGAVGYDGPAGILDIPGSTLLEVTQVNAVGPLLTLRAVLPLLEAAPDAWVVNISSQLGSMEVGLRTGRDVAYNVSKAALNMLVVCAARELEGRGIRSVAFHPGWVRTDMGGAAADIGVEESAAGILAKVDGLSEADNGGFFRWDGSVHPW